MKKSLLIATSLLALWLVTGIYAQTTWATGTILDKMKAVAHSFTLSATLNPSDSGLTSDPVKWKKSGDILTAGEYNRLLELVSEGGSSSGSVNYMQLTTPASVTFVEGGKVPFTTVVSQKGDKITQNGGEITLKGGSSYVISADIRLTSANSALWYTIINKSDWTGVGVYGANYTGVYTDSWAATSAIGFVSPTVDTTYFVRTASMSWAPISNHTGGNFTVWELGGGSGGGGSSSSSELQLSNESPTTAPHFIEATKYCKNLTEGGYSDWRFPNLSELFVFAPISADTNFLWTNAVDYSQWTANANPQYWGKLRMSDGYFSATSGPGDDVAYVRCVRWN